MEIYGYDFDDTVYSGDSSVDFFLFTFRKYPTSIIRIAPKLAWAFVLYFCKKISKKKLKETFFSFLPYISEVDKHIEKFWQKHYLKMKHWYLYKEDHSKDVIISASPEFLLEIPAKKIGIYKLIASQFDKQTGKLVGENCYGEEKVKRMIKECKNCILLEFYSDSISDCNLAKKAKRAFLIKGNKKTDFPKER